MITKTRKEREVEARKLDIMKAAAILFSHKDFHSVSVDEIADKVGLSKGTIYLYFETKENLFFSILIDRTKNLLKALNQAALLEPFETSLRHFIWTYLDYFQKHEAFFKLMHSEKTRSSLEAHYQMHDYATEMLGQFMSTLTRLLQNGIRQNVLRVLDATDMAKGLAGLLNTFTFYRIFTPSGKSPEDDCETIMELFLNGVRRKN
jgi:AcrR family transcriptional regulator